MRAVLRLFGTFGLLALWGAMGVGLVAMAPHLWADARQVPFQILRPLHVTLAVVWILSGASAGVYAALAKLAEPSRGDVFRAKLQLAGGGGAVALILWDYVNARFGGREYLEFSPLWSPLLLGVAVLFAWNVAVGVSRLRKPLPVYAWMWMTGALGLVISFGLSHLWLLQDVGGNVVRDLTFQWMANGSLIGSWNMLVYGGQFFWMAYLTGTDEGQSKRAFFFYFLGFFNLLFNWGHHLYPLPMADLIKHVAYAVSMTEWVLLLHILMTWRKGLPANQGEAASPFFRSAEVWIGLNLILAIAISIPVINQWTHGTHVTVAHAMGSTVGINTFLLLGILHSFSGHAIRSAHSVWGANIGLVALFLGFLGAGFLTATGNQAAAVWGLGVASLGGTLLGVVLTLVCWRWIRGAFQE